jgi:hypothetical protein
MKGYWWSYEAMNLLEWFSNPLKIPSWCKLYLNKSFEIFAVFFCCFFFLFFVFFVFCFVSFFFFFFCFFFFCFLFSLFFVLFLVFLFCFVLFFLFIFCSLQDRVSLCIPSCPENHSLNRLTLNSQRSSTCLCLPSAWIKGLHHHSPASFQILRVLKTK